MAYEFNHYYELQNVDGEAYQTKNAGILMHGSQTV